jgi:hypothetical protein
MLGRFVAALNRVLRLVDARLVRDSTFPKEPPPPAPPPKPKPEVDLEARFLHLRKVLTSPLNFLLLGSSNDVLRLPRDLADRINVFSVDAVSPGQGASFTAISEIVAPDAGGVTFVERSFSGCSSIAPPREDLVRAYGLEALFREKSRLTVQGTTVGQLAERHHVDRWHFMKTDLEGLDFAVVKSLGDDLRRTLVLQMELRFEPFYAGEPHFHEVAAYLAGRGFDVLDLQIERWRYVTPHMLLPTKGRATYCDALFVNREPGDQSTDVLAQALILGILGYLNQAEHLLGRAGDVPPEAAAEIVDFLFGRMRGGEPLLPHPSVPHVVSAAGDC